MFKSERIQLHLIQLNRTFFPNFKVHHDVQTLLSPETQVEGKMFHPSDTGNLSIKVALAIRRFFF